jgi:putrescine transport system permease protein
MRALLLVPAWLWLGLFVAAPAAVLLAIALASPADAVPPFRLGPDLAALAGLADAIYVRAFAGSLATGAATALLCLLLGYPMALAIARSPRRRLLLLFVMLPFWSGVLLRLVAWIGILRDQGLANAALRALGIIETPMPLLHTDFAMLLGLVYCYLPFLVLPVEARLAAADPALEEAAADLGARPWRVFLRVTLPLSLPGVWAGLALVFVPVCGEVVIPDLLGAPSSLTMGRVIWDEFFQAGDWPQAAALAVALLVLLAGPALAVRRH